MGQFEAEGGIPGAEKHTGRTRDRPGRGGVSGPRTSGCKEAGPLPGRFMASGSPGQTWRLAEPRVSLAQASLLRRWAPELLERRGSDGGTELKLGRRAHTLRITTSPSMHLSVCIYILIHAWECVGVHVCTCGSVHVCAQQYG